MRHFFVAPLALFAAVPAHAADWKLIGEYDIYPATIAFVDHDSINRSGDHLDFILIFYREGSSESTDVGVRQQRRASCTGYNFQILSERHWIGTTEQAAIVVDQKNRVAAEGSVDKISIDMICGKRPYGSGTISDPDRYAKDYFEELAWDDY